MYHITNTQIPLTVAELPLSWSRQSQSEPSAKDFHLTLKVLSFWIQFSLLSQHGLKKTETKTLRIVISIFLSTFSFC